MQRKAALWITGAFRTSPTGGTEALAGLIPVHLHLRKLAGHANLRIATLSDTHPIQSLLSEDYVKQAEAHHCSVSNMAPALREKVHGTIMEIENHHHELTEVFEPCAPENRPGFRLMDRFAAQVSFNDFKINMENEALSVTNRKIELNALIDELKDDEHVVYCGTDASLPANIRHQAASAYLIYRQGDVVHRARYIAGRVTAPDTKLYAIHAAIVKACSLPNVSNITLFTDSIASARRAVNPSVHLGQGHSLAVCRALEQWFANGGRSVTFVMVHSRFEWGPHHEAHEFVWGLPPVGGRCMATSLDSLRKKATATCLDSWSTTFQNEKYRGHNFLLLQNLDGGIVQPTYAKGGSWLGEVGGRLLVATCMCRFILGHAPIGSYFQRFNIDKSHQCECGVPL